MKISTFLATGLGVFLLAGAANAATVNYVAHLTGAQSQNANFTSTATADATLTYDDVAKTLTGVIAYPGTGGTGFTITPSGGHLKSGTCTESGTIISALTLEASSTAEGGALSLNNTTPLDDDQITALTSGGLFLTIENTTYVSPESEIRGQIYAAGAANDYCAAALAAAADTDAGTDAGTIETDAGTGVVTTTPVDTTDDSSGCNTTGGSSSPGSSAALALGLGLALYGISRKRKQS